MAPLQEQIQADQQPPERCKKPLNTNGCFDLDGWAAVFYCWSDLMDRFLCSLDVK